MRKQQEMDMNDRRNRETLRGQKRTGGSGGGWMRRWEVDKHKEGIGNVEVEKVNLDDNSS